MLKGRNVSSICSMRYEVEIVQMRRNYVSESHSNDVFSVSHVLKKIPRHWWRRHGYTKDCAISLDFMLPLFRHINRSRRTSLVATMKSFSYIFEVNTDFFLYSTITQRWNLRCNAFEASHNLWPHSGRMHMQKKYYKVFRLLLHWIWGNLRNTYFRLYVMSSHNGLYNEFSWAFITLTHADNLNWPNTSCLVLLLYMTISIIPTVTWAWTHSDSSSSHMAHARPHHHTTSRTNPTSHTHIDTQTLQ